VGLLVLLVEVFAELAARAADAGAEGLEAGEGFDDLVELLAGEDGSLSTYCSRFLRLMR